MGIVVASYQGVVVWLASCGVLAIRVGHGRGTTLGARGVVGGTGQNTKRKLASVGHTRRTRAGEDRAGLVRTKKKGKKKGVSRGNERKEQRDNLEKSSIQSEPTADQA